jgi:hypothetical protein
VVTGLRAGERCLEFAAVRDSDRPDCLGRIRVGSVASPAARRTALSGAAGWLPRASGRAAPARNMRWLAIMDTSPGGHARISWRCRRQVRPLILTALWSRHTLASLPIRARAA